jgi:hypothetical protein
MSNVFISYSHDGKENSRLAEWLRAELKRLGHEAFIYKQDVPLGVEWGQFIDDRLAKCNLIVALLSENSIRSANVIEEIQTADSLLRKHGRPVIISVRVKFDGDPNYQLRAIVNHYQGTSWNKPRDSKPLLEKILTLTNNPLTLVGEAPRPSAKSRPLRSRVLARPFPMASPIPGGAIEKADPFYIKRRIEKSLMELASKKGQTATIEAPRQIGKSSLPQRYLAACERAKQRWALIDLSRFDESSLQNYDVLLGKIAGGIARRLDVETKAPARIGDPLDFGYWLEDHILKRVKEPIVIAFDEADRVFDYAYRRDFFSLLRSWHNERASFRNTWGRLGLVMVISTERNLLIDNATISPFNIGLHVPLDPFDLKQCLRLNGRFEKFAGKSLRENDVERLWELLRGQPYLTHEAIHAVVIRRIGSVKRLIETAADDDGLFADHLRSLLKRISQRSDYNLTAAFKRIIENDAPNDPLAIGRLKAAGLVRIENGRAVPANQLYARFFGRELGQRLERTL